MKERGFAEILLLLLILGALAASIFGFCVFRARVEPSEASGVGSLRVIIVAENSYRKAEWKNDNGELLGYSLMLADLGCWLSERSSPTSACLIDDVLARATSRAAAKNGYYFVYTRTNHSNGFTVNANPAVPQARYYFFTNQTGVIRFSRERPATANDQPLE